MYMCHKHKQPKEKQTYKHNMVIDNNVLYYLTRKHIIFSITFFTCYYICIFKYQSAVILYEIISKTIDFYLKYKGFT